MNLKQAIREACKKNKTNTFQLAYKCGLKPPTLYFILRGNENITVKTAVKLNKAGIIVTVRDNKIEWGLEEI